MKLYMAVTADRLELPLFVGNARELARFLGLKSPNDVYVKCKVANTGKTTGYRVVKVEGGGNIE